MAKIAFFPPVQTLADKEAVLHAELQEMYQLEAYTQKRIHEINKELDGLTIIQSEILKFKRGGGSND